MLPKLLEKHIEFVKAVSERIIQLDKRITELEIKRTVRPVNSGSPHCFGRFTKSCLYCKVILACEIETKGNYNA